MDEVRLSYFYNLGFRINSMVHLRDDVPGDIRHIITYAAWEAIDGFVGDDKYAPKILPRSYAKAKTLAPELSLWANSIYPGRTIVNYGDLIRAVESLSVTLTDELDSTFNYTLTAQGNLSTARLVEGASNAYGEDARELLDESVTKEVDDAGRCLAFTMYTACGFHILRSVEIAIKAYVHAATGALPAVNHRNWGEYIRVLTGAGASPDLVGILQVLKAKRNPLMHPQESLAENEAIDLLCLCQSVTTEVLKDVKKRTLDLKFKASLALLPTL